MLEAADSMWEALRAIACRAVLIGGRSVVILSSSVVMCRVRDASPSEIALVWVVRVRMSAFSLSISADNFEMRRVVSVWRGWTIDAMSSFVMELGTAVIWGLGGEQDLWIDG